MARVIGTVLTGPLADTPINGERSSESELSNGCLIIDGTANVTHLQGQCQIQVPTALSKPPV